MDVRSIANALIDVVCRAEFRGGPGLVLRFPPPESFTPQFVRGEDGRGLLYGVREDSLHVLAEFLPSSPAWAYLEAIARGEALEVGGHRIRLHPEKPFPCIKVLGPLTAVREDDALALTWDSPFRPTIDLRLLPDVLDPEIHSIRLFRSFAVICGGVWKRSIGL